MSIESLNELENSLRGIPETIPADPPSDQLILELFRLLSKELEQKNALIKDLIRAIQSKPTGTLQSADESGTNLSDLISLAQPILAALAAKPQTPPNQDE